MKTIALFGHRFIFNEHKLKEKITALLNETIPQGFSNILIGCHGDFDKIALKALLNYKNYVNNNITINVVLTSLSLLKKDEYGFSGVDFYEKSNCETIFYDIEEVYYKNRITYSNKKMVDNCDLVICCVDMKSYKSGAKTAVNYAIKQNKKIINLYEPRKKK